MMRANSNRNIAFSPRAARCWRLAFCMVAVLGIGIARAEKLDNNGKIKDGPSVADGKPAVRHWAFEKPVRPELPQVRDIGWVRNPIDQFIAARLEKENLHPADAASREAMIRRAYLDVTGLPPTPAEVDAFVADGSADAFEKVVDRLLASPHYGERWARHWLDLARYAESEGFKADETRPNVWRYRDYVIKSFNDDKPYDRFVKEQIAGDEMFPGNLEALVATGFNRHWPDESNARELFQRRQQILDDITDTVGAVFTGLTVACARCHDHKYDPIPQADYYRLQAFFANTHAADDLILLPPDAATEYREKLAAWEQKTRAIREEMAAIEEPHRKAIIKEYVDKYPSEIQAILDKPEQDRTPLDWQVCWKAAMYLDPSSPQYIAPTSAVVGHLKGDAKKRWDELKAEMEKFAALRPADPPRGTGIVETRRETPKTYVLKRGIYDAFGQEVQPAFLSAVAPGPAAITPPADVSSSGRRTALANWLASPDNPLAARVMVNRIWQYHFGQGLVRTSSDFGVQGDRPSHPELLDWLADEFVHEGWSIKKLHRLILTSSTYRQSCIGDAAARRADPDGRLLSHFPRHRLEGEVIRDSALAAAGLLNLKAGGPSIFPELPTGTPTHGGWKVTDDPSERNRRSIYIFVRRNLRYPMFEAFDMPDTHESCPRRYNTTTASQALALLNDKLSLQWAQALAGRVLATAGTDRDAQIDGAYRLAFGRHVTGDESRLIRKFIDAQIAAASETSAAGQPLALPVPVADGMTHAEAAALVDLCHVLINSDEFVYGG
ncbi:MAG: hypothetical protein JWL69_5091 [Phycisphaerales bacterium]|nr:hypothetical protein [Phycisphaerales bacterium]